MSSLTVRPLTVSRKQRCTVCRSVYLTSVFDLPQLPLTGIYTEGHATDSKYPTMDQAWMLCTDCGHGQLQNVIDPKYLYEDTYTHRGGVSPIASGGNDFFVEFLTAVAGRRRFTTLVDIGCSDLYLLKKLYSRAESAWGIDPIWIGKDHISPEGIRVLGKYVEEIDWASDVPTQPDLIVSAHTFEHINEAGQELARAVEAAAEGALFIIEVPGTDSMLSALRFDQVFHQHINYYSVASFQRLIAELGCQYLAHTFNYSFWSGTMLMAFSKHSSSAASTPHPPKITPEKATAALARFTAQLHELMNTIAGVPEPLWGYGAAQMVPILAYHLKSDLGFLQGIFDDNPGRHGKNFPHLAPVIRMPRPETTLVDSAVVILALDSIRPILKRVHALNARRVLLPLHLY